MAKIAERAWAAGLFDGEGSVFASKSTARPKHRKLNMAVVMADRPSIERFATAVDVGTVIRLKRETNAGRTVYRWCSQNEEGVKQALRTLWPFLGEQKRIQACEALASRQIYLNEKAEWRASRSI
jgi:hypothetical protein